MKAGTFRSTARVRQAHHSIHRAATRGEKKTERERERGKVLCDGESKDRVGTKGFDDVEEVVEGVKIAGLLGLVEESDQLLQIPLLARQHLCDHHHRGKNAS